MSPSPRPQRPPRQPDRNEATRSRASSGPYAGRPGSRLPPEPSSRGTSAPSGLPPPEWPSRPPKEDPRLTRSEGRVRTRASKDPPVRQVSTRTPFPGSLGSTSSLGPPGSGYGTPTAIRDTLESAAAPARTSGVHSRTPDTLLAHRPTGRVATAWGTTRCGHPRSLTPSGRSLRSSRGHLPASTDPNPPEHGLRVGPACWGEGPHVVA